MKKLSFAAVMLCGGFSAVGADYDWHKGGVFIRNTFIIEEKVYDQKK